MQKNLARRYLQALPPPQAQDEGEGSVSVTSSGLVCDVCGNHILPFIDESYERFGVRGIERELAAHNACKQSLVDAGTEWEKLPPGPLRTAFEEATAPLTPSQRRT